MQINKNLKFIIFCFIVFLSFDSHTDEGFSISAVIETPQVEINGNADDPAIWFNEEDPSLSIVFGTDKYNGVYSYNLSGDVIGFSKSGSMNNIDLRTLNDNTYIFTTDSSNNTVNVWAVSYTHLRAHETRGNLVCRLLLEKKK